MMLFSLRLNRVPKADHFYESHLGLLLAFAMARRP
jgi:hypothetical protein